MPEKMKKCDICGKDHVVGEACECGWDEVKERAQAKARKVRQRYEEEESKAKPGRKGFFD